MNEAKPFCSASTGHGFKMTFCVAEATCGTQVEGHGNVSCPEKDGAVGVGLVSVYLKIASASVVLLGAISQL